MQKLLAGGMLISSVLVLSGCGCTEWASKKVGEKIVEKGIESQTGAKVDINSDGGVSTIETKEGKMTVSGEGGAKLPDNFPKDIFVYSDAKINMAISSSSQGEGFSVSYTTAAVESDVFSKYKEEMAKNGWKKDTEADMGENGKMLNFSKGKSKVLVMIGNDERDNSSGKTGVALNVTTEE